MDTLRFEPPFLRGWELRDNVRYVHLELIGKRVVDFLSVLAALFSLDVTAEALRTKIDRKSKISLQRGQFDAKFQSEGVVPHHSCSYR